MASSSGIHGITSVAAAVVSHHPSVSMSAQLDGVMIFGCLSTAAAAACYLRRNDGRVAMLTFAAGLTATAIYGFVEGVWPLGFFEAAWAIHAARRGLQIKGSSWKRRPPHLQFAPDLSSRQSRYREIFGPN